MTDSEAYGPLIAALRDAQARGLNVDEALPRLIAARPLDDAEDLAAVLHARIDSWAERAARRHQPASNLIAGLIPRATSTNDADLARALREREQAIEQRASALLEQAIEQRARWLRQLGRPPDDERSRAAWLRQARVIAAYRDLWNVNVPEPVDARNGAGSIEQAGHHRRAAAAALKALKHSQHALDQQPSPTLAVRPDASRGPHRGLEL